VLGVPDSQRRKHIYGPVARRLPAQQGLQIERVLESKANLPGVARLRLGDGTLEMQQRSSRQHPAGAPLRHRQVTQYAGSFHFTSAQMHRRHQTRRHRH